MVFSSLHTFFSHFFPRSFHSNPHRQCSPVYARHADHSHSLFAPRTVPMFIELGICAVVAYSRYMDITCRVLFVPIEETYPYDYANNDFAALFTLVLGVTSSTFHLSFCLAGHKRSQR